MSLVFGINELRDLITKPRDPLYQHLTDLIVALEETNVTSSYPAANGSPHQEKCSLSKRKMRRKKDKKVRQEFSGIGAGGNRNCDPSSNHSPCNAGSESSADDVGQHHKLFSPNVTADMSDSEGELTKRRSSSTNWLKPDFNRLSLGQRTFGVPVESDSFTETFTPARHQRRKRLIKRMAIDPTSAEFDFSYGTGISYRRHSTSMDMEVSNSLECSPKYSKKLRFRKAGSCHSAESSMDCNSSSSESDGNNTSDAGRQGDDEQSDWFFEFPKTSDECMGVPNIRKMLMCKARYETTGLDQSNNRTEGASTLESSDTDMSQSSCCFRSSIKNCGKRLLSKSGPSLSNALNKRLVNFLRSATEVELELGTLRKRERKEALRLASFYHLDVRCKTSKSVQTYTLVKTKYSVWPL